MDKEAKLLEFQEEVEPFQVICRKGNKADDVWLIREGWVGVFSENIADNPESGRILFRIGPFDFIGIETIDSNSYDYTVLSLNNKVRLVRIPIKSFMGFLVSKPDIAWQVILRLVERNSHLANDLTQATSSLDDIKKALSAAKSGIARQQQVIASSTQALVENEGIIESLEDMLSNLILDVDPRVGNIRTVDVPQKPSGKE